ncbi:MAG: phospholipid carrier-dependent glycosyltransferase [Acidobacteria bacterium]|nr:phospholipid carrier-dependent glycosyltransferase [Acidobacteriota bacterium]
MNGKKNPKPGERHSAPGLRPATLAAAATLGGLAVSLALAYASDGAYHDDDICHYLFARDAWTDPNALLHWWARPGYNFPAALAARFFGLAGCRILSGLMTAAVAWLAWLIARRLVDDRRAAALAPALVWLQPLALTLSFTTLTETPAALYLTAGTWLFLRGNRVAGCGVLSLLFVTRLETLALAPLPLLLFALVDAAEPAGRAGRRPGKGPATEFPPGAAFPRPGALVRSLLGAPRNWACGAVLMWAPVAWCLASAALRLDPGSSVLHLFSRPYSSEYGSGPAWHFLGVWPEAASYGLAALAVTGAFAAGRRGLLASIPAGAFLALQSLLFALGIFASGGYARFMVTLAGLVGALASAGLAAGLGAAPGRARAILGPAALAALVVATALVRPLAHPAALVALAALSLAYGLWAAWAALPFRRRLTRAFTVACAGLALFQSALMVRPLNLGDSPLSSLIRDGSRVAVTPRLSGRALLTQHVAAVYIRRNGTVYAYSNPDARARWEAAPPGTLFLWDNKYCYKKHTAADLEESRDLWKALYRQGRVLYTGRREGWAVVLFEKRGPGSAAGPEAPPLESFSTPWP